MCCSSKVRCSQGRDKKALVKRSYFGRNYILHGSTWHMFGPTQAGYSGRVVAQVTKETRDASEPKFQAAADPMCAPRRTGTAWQLWLMGNSWGRVLAETGDTSELPSSQGCGFTPRRCCNPCPHLRITDSKSLQCDKKIAPF